MTITIDPFNKKDIKDWQEAADLFKAVADALDLGRLTALNAPPEAAGAPLEKQKILADVRSANTFMQGCRWPDVRYFHAYGAVDTDTLIALAREKVIKGEHAACAKAMYGTPEDLQKIEDALGKTIADDTLLYYAAWPHDYIAAMPPYRGNPDTTALLLGRGANPYHGNGSVFLQSALNGNAAVTKLLAAKLQTLYPEWITNAWKTAKANNLPLAAALYPWHDAYGQCFVVDKNTIEEFKELRHNNYLKRVFDFSARRVTEASDMGINNRQVFFRDIDFGDYDQAALAKMRQKLIDLGGQPEELGGATVRKDIHSLSDFMPRGGRQP